MGRKQARCGRAEAEREKMRAEILAELQGQTANKEAEVVEDTTPTENVEETKEESLDEEQKEVTEEPQKEE